MADENDLNINITGNASGLKGASDQAKAAMGGVAGAAKNIENAFKTVSSAIDPTFVALEKYNKAQAANTVLLTAGTISATEWANQQVKLRVVYDDQVAAINRKIAAHKGEAIAGREAAEAAEELARAERQQANAAQDLRASIDPAFAAQQRYNQVMQQATGLLMTGKLRQGEWTAIQRQAKTQMDINVRSLGRMNSMYVQLGYQAQDVTASLASGISPLVILAQQGGQTAAALSQAGGKIGYVASIIAGPYGAAIIGATLLLGYFLQSTKDTKKETVDLMDAESRRAAALPKLTDAIREFTKAQEEANRSESESLRLKGLMVEQTEKELEADLKDAEAKARAARAQATAVRNMPRAPDGVLSIAQLGLIASTELLAKRAEQKVKDLKAAFGDLEKGGTQLEITQGIREAQEATDKLTEARHANEKEMDKITVLETLARNAARAELKGTELQNALNRIHDDALKARIGLTRQLQAAEKAIADERRKSTRDTRTPQQVFQDFEAELNKRGVQRGAGRTGFRTAEDQNQIYRQGESPLSGYGAGISRHQSYQALDPSRATQNDKAAYEAATAAGLKGFHIVIESEGRKHYEWRGSMGKGNVDVTSSEAEAKKELTAEQKAQKEAAQAAHDAKVAEIEFNKTLAGEDLDTVVELQKNKIDEMKKFYGENSAEAIAAGRELVLIQRRQDQQLLADTKATMAQQLKAAEATEKARADLAESDRGIRRDNVDTRESTGMITEKQARIERAAILDEEYADQQAHEERMYQLKLVYLRGSLLIPDLSLDEARKINGEIEDLERDHLTAMAELNSNYQRDVNQVRNQAFSQQAAKWREMASTISGSMRQAFQGIWTHQTTFFQTMINMADAIVYKFADMGAKVLEDWIVKQAVKMGLIHTQNAAETAAVVGGQAAQTAAVGTGEATRQGIGTVGVAVKAGQEVAKSGAAVASEVVQTGAKVGGEATRGTVGAAGAVAEIGTRAATSAAGAFSSTVVIPFIGPVAAPIAAAAALAAVLGFAALVSARGGQGQVPSDGQITELHKDEMVLPAWIASPMRDSLRNPQAKTASIIGGSQIAGADARAATHAGGGDRYDFHYGPQHTNMGAGFDELLRADGRSLRKWIKNEVRNGSIKLK